MKLRERLESSGRVCIYVLLTRTSQMNKENVSELLKFFCFVLFKSSLNGSQKPEQHPLDC